MKIKTVNYINNQILWLKTYVDAENNAIRRAVDKVEITNKEAVDKVENNNANYRETQNEWRGQIKDQSTNFITRREIWIGAIAIISILIALYFKR